MRARIPLSIVTRSLDCGGAEQHLLQVLPRLNDGRFEVRLYPLLSGGSLTESFIDQGIHVVSSAHSFGRLHKMLQLGLDVRRRQPIVHCFLPEAYLFGASLALTLGASSIVMSRRSRNHYQERHPIAAWGERCLHRHMDALLGNSQAVVQDLLDEGAPPDRVRLIYNGVDADRFLTGEAREARRHALLAVLGVSGDKVVLTCVANLFHYKGHLDLLAALELLSPRLLDRTVLLLVGRDMGMREALEKKIALLGLSANVRFLGERNDVSDLLAASDVGVLASHEEGFSNAVIEGMASGLPMVVTDVGGNGEAVVNESCGYVVPVRNPQKMAKALSKLIEDAGRRQAMGEMARRTAVASFSMEACIKSYESFYEEIWERSLSAARSRQ